jgi:hypothetical protein
MDHSAAAVHTSNERYVPRPSSPYNMNYNNNNVMFTLLVTFGVIAVIYNVANVVVHSTMALTVRRSLTSSRHRRFSIIVAS